jgi:predicted RNase H-like HicB family nuclease
MRKKIIVEGFEVMIDKGEHAFVLTVPELPGVVGQVASIDDARDEIRKLIMAHVRSLANKK